MAWLDEQNEPRDENQQQFGRRSSRLDSLLFAVEALSERLSCGQGATCGLAPGDYLFAEGSPVKNEDRTEWLKSYHSDAAPDCAKLLSLRFAKGDVGERAQAAEPFSSDGAAVLPYRLAAIWGLLCLLSRL
ncbi:MAG: hypothetical protein MZV65_00060 [Chromatiales bacterium]|nr:hypothetical protein [Chromatiales bacterium]